MSEVPQPVESQLSENLYLKAVEEPSPKPDVTKLAGTALVLAGIPILSRLAEVFGIFAPTPEQQEALGDAVQWGVIAGGFLVAHDALLRGARNIAGALKK